ncbi:MAG: hypothetical protein ACRESJ_00245 [Pseudomonas sp.]|uniref:hypothetical protein n=1 Tax=Pseudomonas sp. TaxID=306 RepID=UPI003D6FF3FF
MTNFSMDRAAGLNNLVKDGEFKEVGSPEWSFKGETLQSLAVRDFDAGNPHFAASLSGSATQVVGGITASTLYTLSVRTRGSERQSDGQSQNPTGYMEVIGGGLELRFFLRDVHDWKEQKVRFRSVSATESLQITFFAITGKLDFDDVLLAKEEEVIDPDELLKNGFFSEREAYWEWFPPAVGKAEIFLDNGNPCALFSNVGSASQSVNVTPGKTYILKFRVKVVGPDGAQGGRVYLRNLEQGVTEKFLKVTNDWIDDQVEHTVFPSGHNTSLQVSLSGGTESSGTTTYFDNVSLKLKE